MSDNELTIDEINALTQRILAYQDQTLNAADVQALETELRSNPAKRRLFVQLVIDETLVNELLQDRDKVTPVPERKSSPRIGRLALRCAALVAVLLAVAALLLRESPQTPTASPPLATVTFAQQAQWQGNQTVFQGEKLRTGNYRLTHGLARLRMADGTDVSLTAPVSFDVLDQHILALHAGTLGARVTEPNSQFTVQTRSMDVIDLGTSFGVHVDGAGDSTVAVFEGSVRLKQRTQDSREPLDLLFQGDAARADSNGQIIPIDLNPELFEKLWPLTAGIDEVSDFITFVPPLNTRPLAEYRSNTKVHLLPEQQNVPLRENLDIDFKLPLQLIAEGRKPRTNIVRGRRVSSYLLFFNSEEPKSWGNPQTIEGSVRFAEPVLGIISSDKKLQTTDTLLGLSDAVYPHQDGRGLKLGGKKLPGIPEDKIDLSNDRRTLSFCLHTGPNMDSLRVLVRAD